MSRHLGKAQFRFFTILKIGPALKLTIAQYLTPGDVSIQSVGIRPDIEIRASYLTKERIHLFAEEALTREKDLDHHLDRHSEKSGKVSERPLFSLANLVEEVEEAPDADANPDKFRSDFEIDLAKDLLRRAKKRSRADILEAAKSLIDTRKRRPSKRIIYAIGSYEHQLEFWTFDEKRSRAQRQN